MRGGLCISLTPSTLGEIFDSDLSGADLVEIRLDYLKIPQESTQMRWDRLPVPVIATCRGRDCGGQFGGSVEEELRILETAARNGARFVDMDYRFARRVGGVDVIGSYHNFRETPANVEEHLEAACRSHAQIAKIATAVNSWADNRRLLDLMSRSSPKPVIITGMGDMGQISRIIGPSRGSFLTYATAQQPSETAAAPGQLTAREMNEVYRFPTLGRGTRLLGVLGNALGHSKSPLLHNRAFAASGLDFVCLKFPATDVKDFFENARSIGIEGFSVTIPHKTAVIPYMVRLTDGALEAGAVNTVHRCEGGWVGDNTDVHGVRAALASVNCKTKGKKVLILGSGGAARAAAVAVKDAAEIVVLLRTERKHENWNVKVRFDVITNFPRYACDVLINATPVGMSPASDASPIDGPITADVVFDVVYNPPITRFLRSAAEQGKTIISGTAMFLAQAARQFEIWTGKEAPPEIYEDRALVS